ncbi:MAG: hypothetical protein P8L44_04920 [Opitutales bacterium]|nr:hypothetical protein [Opitutales bacterium]
MKTEKLNSWLNLGANIGVLIGLALLVFEIRQNSDLMRAQISQSRSETQRAGMQSYMNSPYIPSILVKLENNEALTDEESIRYSFYVRGILRNFDNQYWQYKQGFLGDETPQAIEFWVRNIIGTRKGGIELWDQYRSAFADDFAAFVEEAIADLR